LYASGSIVLCNNTCSNNGGGFYLEYSGGNSVANNTCLWNAEYGLCIVELSTGNRIWNNTFIGNNGATGTYDASRVQAFDEGTNNSWNTSGSPHGYGNYWSDWTTPDANLDDIVDQPYLINGSAGAKDYYPQTTTSTPIPEFDLVPLVLLTLMAATILLEETRRKKES
jgi:parallel beta-helix repeat protein